MSVAWDENKIASLLRSAFVPQQRPAADVSANIDVLVTFDAGGVSSHPNHASLYHGARAFVAGLLQGKPTSPVALYTLSSVNMLRKYSSIGDAVTTLVAYWMRARNDDGTNESKDGKEAHPSGLVFMNSLTGEAALGTAWSAMTDAHKSQMVWFRYLWITFSRYMVINDLWLEEVREDGK
jgi:N-acetylglucosaminylphosphatidylinositol deacetylase